VDTTARRQRHPARQQQGAVAVMFGLTLVALLAAGGLVIDLGHLYVLKSELQNGADSGALAGAEEIDMTAAGVSRAAAKAIAFAGQNNFNFSSALVLTNADISFGSAPDGPWSTVSEASASPSGKTFIRVNTGNRTVPTYLMGVAGIPTIATSGVAVAGRFVVDITPLGVCAVDPANRLNARLPLTVPAELVEYGFRRGTTYDMLSLKNIAGSSDPMLINPVDTPPSACGGSHSSANFTAPFLCQGNSAATNNATAVYVNTGVSAGPVESALNSRFNDYSGGSSCVPATAPPDRNIQPYVVNDTTSGSGKWMTSNQANQSQPISSLGVVTPATTTGTQGVLWSYSRPLQAVGSPGSYTAGAEFSTTDWATLYNGSTTVAGQYPAGAGASPYSQTSGAYFQLPGTNTPTVNRRLMNLAILDCTIPVGSGACKQVPLLGVGRFFMQRPAALTGSSPGLWVEFAGLIEPVPNSEIKLYR
jgi:Flp pilus assembly protein TadG